MNMGLRKTGIDVIGDVPWGTHISQLYSQKDDFLDVLALYIKEGLSNNELCIWIYSQNTVYEEIAQFIKKYVINIEDYIDSGQLKLIPHTKWYIKDNSFNDVRVNEQWRGLVKHALDSGFDGLRAVADTAWLEKCYYRTFSDYEQNINKMISELPFIVICLYDMNKIDILEFAEIINNHSYIILSDNSKLKLLKNVELLVKAKQLEHSKEDYKRLLQFLPDAVFIHDKQKIVYCNEASAQIVGIEDPNKLIGKSIIDLIVHENRDNFKEFIDKILDKKADSNFLQSRLVDKSGQFKDIEVVAGNCFYNGFPAVLFVVRDVSHLKRIVDLERDIERNTELLNETLEYDKIKTEFFSNITHELRTPLNVILSALQLIDMLKDDSTLDKNNEKKYLKMMKQNCYRLLRLANNLIDLTKIDSGFFELNLKNCNIVEVVEDITLSVAGYIESKGIELQFDTNTEEKVVACDPDQIERIILNLLSNAVKFTLSGGNIWVNLVDLGNKILITVRDNGIGIPKDKQDIIFNRFQQVNKSFNKQNEGSGIGLALVKSLVEKHGGKITVTSEVGRGSEFTLEILCKTLTCPKSDSNVMDSLCDHNYVERANIEFSDIYV